jgi:hypothetical protein
VRLALCIKQCHNILSYIILSNSLISKSFLIVSLLVFLGLLLPILVWLPYIWSTPLTIESTSLLSTRPNHLSRVFTNIFSIIILSCLVLPHIQCKILIFTTLILFSCWLFTSQHSFHTTSPVLRLYDKIFPLAWAVLLYHIERLTPSSISTTPLEFDGLHFFIFLCFVLWTQDT